MAAADTQTLTWRLYFGREGYAVVKSESPEGALLKLPPRKRRLVTKTSRVFASSHIRALKAANRWPLKEGDDGDLGTTA